MLKRRNGPNPGDLVIPCSSTSMPVSPLEVIIGAAIGRAVAQRFDWVVADRVFLAVAITAFPVIVWSHMRDYRALKQLRRIDFQESYGSPLDERKEMPAELYDRDICILTEQLNDNYEGNDLSLDDQAGWAGDALCMHHKKKTGQGIYFPPRVRKTSLFKHIMPDVAGSADGLLNDIVIYNDSGPLVPAICVHEFSHRLGYKRELAAQLISYYALAESGVPFLEQAARARRFTTLVSARNNGNRKKNRQSFEQSQLRDEIKTPLIEYTKYPTGLRGLYTRIITPPYAAALSLWLRATGQQGLAAYHKHVVDYLYTAKCNL